MNTTTTEMAVAARPCPGPSKKQLVKAKARELAERGMATAEYAVGILAAVALALVLIKVFNAGGFIDTIFKLIGSIFDKILGWLP